MTDDLERRPSAARGPRRGSPAGRATASTPATPARRAPPRPRCRRRAAKNGQSSRAPAERDREQAEHHRGVEHGREREQRAARQPVGEVARREREQRQRNELASPTSPRSSGLPLDLVDLPADRDRRPSRSAKPGRDQRGREEAEVAVPERRARRAATARGGARPRLPRRGVVSGSACGRNSTSSRWIREPSVSSTGSAARPSAPRHRARRHARSGRTRSRRPCGSPRARAPSRTPR